MGFLSRNTTSLGTTYDIAADESYCGECGALRITLEGLQNEQALFEAMVFQDFNETQAMMEGASEEELEVMQEASVSGFFAKIKEIIKKIAEKIKGLIKTFITKINSVIIRDNKKFVDKYKREVLTKDLSKMKYKYMDLKKEITREFAKTTESAEKLIEEWINNILTPTNITDLSAIEDKINDKLLDELASVQVNGADYDSYEKEFHNYIFDDEEEKEGLSSSELSKIMSILVDSKLISDLEKSQKNVDKVFNDYLKFIDKQIGRMSKNIPDGTKEPENDWNDKKSKKYGLRVEKEADSNRRVSWKEKNGDSKDIAMKKLVLIQSAVSKSQGAFSKFSSCLITETKVMISQARRTFAKAAAYNPKSVKESALFESHIDDAVQYDLDSLFESPSFE